MRRAALVLATPALLALCGRRLAKKEEKEFLTRDLGGLEVPSEEDLHQFYKDHADRYVEPARVSL